MGNEPRAIVAAGVAVHLLFALAAGPSPLAFIRPIHHVRRVVSAVRAGALWSASAAAVGQLSDVLAPGKTFRLRVGGLGDGMGGCADAALCDATDF